MKYTHINFSHKSWGHRPFFRLLVQRTLSVGKYRFVLMTFRESDAMVSDYASTNIGDPNVKTVPNEITPNNVREAVGDIKPTLKYQSKSDAKGL
jgi:hypothetical protein